MPSLARVTLPSLQFWGLLVSIVAIFAMGGSSRSDTQSLVLLNPLIMACCGVALLSLSSKHLAGKNSLLAGILLAILMVGTYITPLTAQIANLSIRSADLATLGAAVDQTGGTDFFIMSSSAVWHSLFFLFTPLAVLLMGLQLNRDDLYLSVPLLIAVGAISGVIGILQLVGNATGPLYFYQITNNGSAVGLFANRNHAAVFLACLFPMLALFAAKSAKMRHGRNASQVIAMAIAVTLVPLILITGSRSGMLTATIGLIGATLIYISQSSIYRKSTMAKPVTTIWAAAILVCLILLTVYFSRAEAIERIFVENGPANDRADFWTSSLQLFWQYFPFGFGPGGFVPAFQHTEPLALLDQLYLNRLHNDWLETALTFGVSGILLMLTGGIYYVRRSFVLWMRMDGERSDVALGRMASVIIAILGIASLSDYPLRTPAIAGFAALALVWLTHARPQPLDC